MKKSPTNDIFGVAETINDQISSESQAKKIVNAYKAVEGYNVSKKIQKPQPKPQQVSLYAKKVKETLHELNENKIKESKTEKRQIQMVTDIQEETLKRKGLMKLSKLLIIKYKNLK